MEVDVAELAADEADLVVTDPVQAGVMTVMSSFSSWQGQKMHGNKSLLTDVLKGRTCSAYPACRYEVERAGGTYADIAIDGAFTEGNLVTAPAWPAHPAWMAQFLALLGTRISL